MSRLKQITRTFLLFLLATALVSTSLFSVPVRAEPYPSQAENQIKGTVYYTSLAACMSAGTLGRSLAVAKQGAFTYDEMSSGEWFRQNTDGAFWLGYLANDDGKTPIDTGRNCSINNDGVNLLKSVYTYLGVTNPLDFLCRFPTFRVLSDPDKKTGIEGCMKATGSDKFYFSARVETSDVLQVMGHYRSINTPSIGVLQTGQGALGYLFNWNTFAKLCRGSITPGADPNLSSVIMVTVADIDPTANLMTTKRVPYTFANGITSSTEILVGTDHNNLV